MMNASVTPASPARKALRLRLGVNVQRLVVPHPAAFGFANLEAAVRRLFGSVVGEHDALVLKYRDDEKDLITACCTLPRLPR